jgi:phosphoribosyl 1,2-cyclic phosphodiesterase
VSTLRFAALGSGSRGNATIVEAGKTRVMIDNGFSVRECTRRLGVLGVSPDTLSAILVTHEHSDHSSGVAGFAARHGVPVFLSAGTRRAMEARGHFDGLAVDCRRIVRGAAFTVGDISVMPVRVPHDAQEPCQYVFDAGGARLGVLTDLGDMTPQLIAAYGGCDALMLECNHDVGMLNDGPYPLSLKARVGGEFGHMSNAQAAALLRALDTSRLKTLVVGHLSEKNNRESLARAAVSGALGWPDERVLVASQTTGHGWLTVMSEGSRVAGHSGA